MKRLTKDNYTDDVFEKQKELIQIDKHTRIHYSQGNYNEDLWKVAKEKEDLEEQIGCPLDVYVKIQYGLVDTIYVKRYETVRKYWDDNGLQLEQKEVLCPRKITRVNQKYFYYQDLLGKESIAFCEYAKEFWLKEDMSE